MWTRGFLLLLLLLGAEAAAASQCWQGATFSEAVVSPAMQSSGILRVPGASTLPQCVAACCDLPGYDLAWLFEGSCFILSCQQVANCQPRQTPGADSLLAFLRRRESPPPQKLLLQSLVRGDPYGGRWRSRSSSSEAPGDLEELKDLGFFSNAQPDVLDPGALDYSEAETATDQLTMTERDAFNRSEADEGQGRGGTQVGTSTAADNITWTRRNEEGSRSPTDPEATDKTTKTESSSVSSSPTWSTTDSAPRDHIRTSSASSASSPTLATPLRDSSSSTTTATSSRPSTAEGVLKTLPTAAETAPTSQTVTSDLHTVATTAPSLGPAPAATATPTVPACPPAASVGGASNRAPVAVVGPDRKLILPLTSLLLDGRGSTDDRGIVSYHWDALSGPPGLQMDGADQAVATASGLRVGRYTFRLTVSDQQGATDIALLTVRVQEAVTPPPPVAHASGSHSLTLPDSAIVLRGSVTDGDQSQVHFLWVRDRQSPAAGDVLYGSETQASLYLANLVEGTYLFQLKVTDALGRSSAATATVEVRPEPGGDQQVELELLVPVSQVSLSQKDTVVRQLAALLHVLDQDIQVRALQGHSHLSTVLRFSVVSADRSTMQAWTLVRLLKKQLLGEKSDFLLFRVLRVDTVLCLLLCSGRGQCDPITKACSCDPFWTENLIRRYLGDGQSNCEWRVLYVVLSSFLLVVVTLSVGWTVMCCRRKGQSKVRKKTKYTILDNMDEQERVELRPKFSIKHRSTEHNSSLMMSESEMDSDPDAAFGRVRSAATGRPSGNGTRRGVFGTRDPSAERSGRPLLLSDHQGAADVTAAGEGSKPERV